MSPDTPHLQFPLVVRSTIVVVILRILMIAVALLAIYLLPLAGFVALGIAGVATFWGIAGLIIILILFVGFTLFSLVLWRNNRYEIYRNRIVHREGVFWKREHNLRFPSLDQIHVNQPFLGTIFHYGDVFVMSAETEETLTLKDIPRPKYYENIIQFSLPDAERY